MQIPMVTYKKIVGFFLRNINIIYLFLAVFISYSQILAMGVWQDDNALFFKLAHINERAGYLGYGIFGEGAYKYTATFYYPIYLLFGFNTFYYFLLSWIFYFVSVLCIYFVFKKILGNQAGFWSSFFYASGYLASDGFIRLFNSIITSVSVMFICFFIYFYYFFFRHSRIKNYIFALVLFFLAVEFARARTHYLIIVPFLFELFNLSNFSFKKISLGIVRLIPFGVIFYIYFVINSDARSGNILNLLKELLTGNFLLLFNYFNSISNLIFPSWFLDLSIIIDTKVILMTKRYIPFIELTTALFLVVSVYLIYKKIKFHKIILGLFFIFIISSFYILHQIIKTNGIVYISHTALSFFLGFYFLIFIFLVTPLIKKELRSLYIIMVIWLFTNIGAYWSYNPQVIYEPVNRYLAHSFFCLAALIGIFAVSLKKSRYQLFFYLIVVVLCVSNLIQSVNYQKNILKIRTEPANRFYSQLKKELPIIKKNDVIYFDVHPNSQSYFSNSFSVAQMPESTAIAWRYGLDRYDFEIFTDYDHFEKYLISHTVSLDKVSAFWYKDGVLDNTSKKMKTLLENHKFSISQAIPQSSVIINNQNDSFIYPIDKSVPTLTKLRVTFRISAVSQYIANSLFRPISRQKNQSLINYLQYKKEAHLDISTTSSWQDRNTMNLTDKNTDTYWQSDRIQWGKEKTYIIIDLKKIEQVGRIVWINGFANNTPENILVDLSNDRKSYWGSKNIRIDSLINDTRPQIIDLGELKARYVRLHFIKTINDDAPTISEIYRIPNTFNKLSIDEIIDFEKNPLSFVRNETDFDTTLESLNFRGNMQVYWQTDKNKNFVTNDKSKIELIYDGVSRDYILVLPAGGTKLLNLKFGDFQIPGTLNIQDISFEPVKIKE